MEAKNTIIRRNDGALPDVSAPTFDHFIILPDDGVVFPNEGYFCPASGQLAQLV
jgi:hypothetical protein